MTIELARRTLIAAGLAATAARAVPASPGLARFPIWPGPPPGGERRSIRDETVLRAPEGPADNIAWTHVATPMLTVVPAARPNGSAVLLIPGGSYLRVAVGRGGSEIAHRFAARGVTAFDLVYRLPHDGWAAGPDTPLQDAQRAMRVIRSRAGEWGVDPARVGAMGFSAGGHLAARLGSRSALATYSPVDAADRLPALPVVLGLCFPVITLAAPDAHAASRANLLGDDASDARIRAFSADSDLPADMPPTFVGHAADDPVVPVANSLRMFAALQTAKIPSELMVFEHGGHNLPIIQPDGTPHPWPALFAAFAARHGLPGLT